MRLHAHAFRKTMTGLATVALLVMTIEGCGRPRTTGYEDECIGEECTETSVDASACETSADCVAGAVCTDGVCVAETLEGEEPAVTTCNSTNDCPMGEFCDLTTNTCVGCLTDEHCDLGLYCLDDGTCGSPTVDDTDTGGDTGGSSMSCESDVDCPTGYDCVDGMCAPTQNQGLSCTEQSDCDPYGRVCYGGQCEPCSASILCPEGLQCSSGICIDPSQNPDGGGSGGLPGGGGLDDLLGGGATTSCNSQADCDSTCTVCNLTTNTCESCGPTVQCVNGLQCFDMAPLGAFCVQDPNDVLAPALCAAGLGGGGLPFP